MQLAMNELFCREGGATLASVEGMQRMGARDGSATRWWCGCAMSGELLHSGTQCGGRDEFCRGRGFDGSVERQAVLLMHSDMQQSTSVLDGTARVALHTGPGLLHHGA